MVSHNAVLNRVDVFRAKCAASMPPAAKIIPASRSKASSSFSAVFFSAASSASSARATPSPPTSPRALSDKAPFRGSHPGGGVRRREGTRCLVVRRARRRDWRTSGTVRRARRRRIVTRGPRRIASHSRFSRPRPRGTIRVGRETPRRGVPPPGRTIREARGGIRYRWRRRTSRIRARVAKRVVVFESRPSATNEFERGDPTRAGRAFEARDDETREHVRVRELVHAERGVERARALAVHQKTLVAGEGVGEGDAGGERDERSRRKSTRAAPLTVANMGMVLIVSKPSGDAAKPLAGCCSTNRSKSASRSSTETASNRSLPEPKRARVSRIFPRGGGSRGGSNRRRVRVREGASRRPRTPGTARGDVQHGRVRRAEKRREPTPTILEGIRGARNRLGTRLGILPVERLPAAARTPRLCARRARARRRARERAATRRNVRAPPAARAPSRSKTPSTTRRRVRVEGSVLASTTHRGRRAHSRGGHARRKRPRKLRR